MLKRTFQLITMTAVSLLISACSGYKTEENKHPPLSSIKFLTNTKLPKGAPLLSRTALLKGKLVVIDNCLYLQDSVNGSKQKTNSLTTWSWNIKLQAHDNKLKIVNSSNQHLATVGEFNKFGGSVSRVNKEVFRGCKTFGRSVVSIATIVFKK